MGRPRLYTDDQRREKRRLKYLAWRAKNLERSREIGRNCEKRRNDAKAIAAGRVPGAVGRPITVPIEKKRADRAARTKRYYYEDIEHGRALGAARARNRRARIREVGGTHTAEDIAALIAKQKGNCTFCLQRLGNGKYDVDHHVPLALGGSNDPSNLHVMHQRCNRMKHTMHPIEFALRNGMLCW